MHVRELHDVGALGDLAEHQRQPVLGSQPQHFVGDRRLGVRELLERHPVVGDDHAVVPGGGGHRLLRRRREHHGSGTAV